MKKTFKLDDKEYAVITPTAKVRRDSQIEHGKVFGQLLKAGELLTRAELDKLIAKNEIWSADLQKQYKELNTKVAENIAALEAGNMKLNKARELALTIADQRAKLSELTSEYKQYDDITMDAKAEEAAFDYLVSKCLVDNETGEQVYKDIDDYIEHKDDTLASMGYINMMQLEYGSLGDIQKSLPENKFLIEWKFVNDDLRFINKDGQLVDREGKLVTEDGEYIDQEVKNIERQPFLDDDGNPIEKPE